MSLTLPSQSRTHRSVPGAQDIEGAYARACAILRQEGQMTVEQFHELDGLFPRLGAAQFAALTDDGLHLARLRQYEILAWRHPRAAGPVLAIVLILCLAVAIALSWG